jgi:hypothetical protein
LVKAWGATNLTEGVYVTESKFETSGSGVDFQDCNDCWVEGSYLEDAPSACPVYKHPYTFLRKQQGEGVRFINNTLDMKPNSPLVQNMSGVLLVWHRTGSAFVASESAQVIGNAFTDMQNNTLQRGIYLYGYNSAVISGNRFKCDPALPSCTTAVIHAVPSNCTTNCDRKNVISNNNFDGFTQNSINCPILFDPPSQDNLVTGNVFAIPSKASGDDGVCGPNEGLNKVTTDNLATTP